MIPEGIEEFLVELHVATNAHLGVSQTVLTDILDNDLIRVSFEQGDLSEFEGRQNIPIKVLLENTPAVNTVIPINISGSASPTEDFTLSAAELIIAAGQNEQTFYLSLLDDSLNELPETVFLTFGEIVGGCVGQVAAKTIMIKDTDPVITLLASEQSFTEGDGSTELAVRLSAPTNQDVVIPLQYSGAAQRNQDFNGPDSVTIPAGNTSASITLVVLDDPNVETTESLIVALGAPTSGANGSPHWVTLSLRDNDVPLTLSFSSRSYDVSEDSLNCTVTVQLNYAATDNVTVSLNYIESSAVVDEDFLRGPASLTIPRGATSGDFSVSIINDSIRENTDSFVISFGSSSNAILPLDPAMRQTTITIWNDDELTAAQLQLMNQLLLDNASAMVDSLSSGDPSGDDWYAAYQEKRQDPDFEVIDAVLWASEAAMKKWVSYAGGMGFHVMQYLRESYGEEGGGIDEAAIERDIKDDPWLFGRSLLKEVGKEVILDGLAIGISAVLGDPTGITGAAIVAIADYIGENVTWGDLEDGWNNLEDAYHAGLSHTEEELRKISIKSVVGGYANGTLVFFDTDFNGLRSNHEPFGTTSADGYCV